VCGDQSRWAASDPRRCDRPHSVLLHPGQNLPFFTQVKTCAERLDAAVQEHVDSYVDPWSDQGADPMTPGQFRTSLPLEVLPTVPSDRAQQLLGGAW
jgi:hypothetical protein